MSFFPLTWEKSKPNKKANQTKKANQNKNTDAMAYKAKSFISIFPLL